MSVIGAPAYNRFAQVSQQAVQKKGMTAADTIQVPANSYIDKIIVKNNNGNAITGGLKFGTTAGGVDVVAALAVGANAFVAANPLLSVFSKTAAQTIHIDAVTLWNGANVDVTIVYGRLPS